MATTTISAADPDTETTDTAAQTSPLAQLFTPVQPARPHHLEAEKPLGSTAALKQELDSDSDTRSNAKTPGEGPVAALVRAFAARLKRTGTATTVKQNHDIKETRVSGHSGNHTTASKADQQHRSNNAAQHRTARDAKLADLNNKASQHHGRTGHDVKKTDNTSARSDTSAKNIRDGKDHRGSTSATADTKTAKTDNSAKDARDRKDHRGASTDASSSRAQKDVPATDKPAEKTTQPGSQAKTSPGGKEKQDAPGAKPGDAPSDKAPAKEGDKKPGGSKGDSPETSTTDGEKARDGERGVPDTAAPTEPQQQPLKTRPSREAGYRDGHRAATAVGHVKAWRDGTRDGWDDRTAADDAERKHMNTARARNATRPEPPAAPQMAPAEGSTADLRRREAQPTSTATPPVPAQVIGVGEKAITFTADGAQHRMSRGEVRTLKAFMRRMGEKKTNLTQITDGSRDTRALAAEHAARAQRLLEDAKSVEGGDGLTRVLARLAEQAQVLRAKAEEIEKQAGRSHEALNALTTNAETRHGGIYKAVVDSPLTAPAERDFYQDKQGN